MILKTEIWKCLRGGLAALVLASIAVAPLSGCYANLYSKILPKLYGVEDIKSEGTYGEARTDFDYPLPEVVAAARRALDVIGANTELEETPEPGTHVLYANSGLHIDRQGEVLRLRFEPSPTQGRTLVYMLSHKQMATNPIEKSTGEYAYGVFGSMDIDLKIRSLRDPDGGPTQRYDASNPAGDSKTVSQLGLGS